MTVVAERSLLGAGTLGGGALLPATRARPALWHQYLQGFHPTGVGSPSTTPPYLVILALLATVLTGKAWLAVDVHAARLRAHRRHGRLPAPSGG